jgi:ubiquinone biosynthesis protein UbiJ
MGLISEEGFAKIRARIESVDPNDRKVVAVFKFKIRQDGEIVKTMILDLVNLKLYEGDDDAECTITIDDQLLADIIEKKTDAMEALNKDLIEVEGNLELLYVLKDQISSLK